MFGLSRYSQRISHSLPPIHSFLSLSSPSFSTLKSPCLVRDFIQDRLYHPNDGYFCKENMQIGEFDSPINFKDLIGHEAYTKEYIARHPGNAWLSPSELFKPYYGMTVGNYINQVFQKARAKNKDLKIKILEVGAGGGATADGVLSYFKNYETNHYDKIQYKIIDISSQMCKKAKQRLEKEHKRLLEREQITIVNEDFLSYNQHDEELTFVLLFEVLDSLPHDRVYYSKENNGWHYETWVEFDDQAGEKKLKEVKKPIDDGLIKQATELLSALESQNQKQRFLKRILDLTQKKDVHNIFLPTCSLKMLENIKKLLPSHHLIIADFDMLRSSENVRYGIHSPIVSKKLEKSFEKQDFESYLVKRGEADIFFPTDFQYLKYAYQSICGKNAEIFKTYEFMDRFAKAKWTETKSGYNPLKEDFSNTSVLTTRWEDTASQQK